MMAPYKRYAFWNNKGGVGKTFLTFMVASKYALSHPDIKTVVIDMCPQANVSEILLGGNGKGSDKLDDIIACKNSEKKKTIGGYFESRLGHAASRITGSETYYLIKPKQYADKLPDNLRLIAGDPALELLVGSINNVARQEYPPNQQKSVLSWLINLQSSIADHYNQKVAFFIDCNPSFAIYTQQALLAATRLIVPCTADGASARAFDNIAKLVYGHNIPEDYQEVSFKRKVETADLLLPKMHLVAFNRHTTSSEKPSAAFKAMYASVQKRSEALQNACDVLTPGMDNYINIPDAHAVAIVACAKALPLQSIKPGSYQLSDGTTQINKTPLERYQQALDSLMARI